MLRTVNLARSIYAIAPQSSIFIPIVDPPHPLPSYVNIEPQSEWHTSSLIISAVETVTLPSRLRGYHDLEAALAGDSGVRKIFELQSSVIPDKASRPEQPLGPEKPGPKKEVKEEDEPEAEFDLNFTDNERTGNKPHIFNQVEVLRGLEPEKKDEPWFAEDPGLARKRRRLELGSIFERLVFLYILVQLVVPRRPRCREGSEQQLSSILGHNVIVGLFPYGMDANVLLGFIHRYGSLFLTAILAICSLPVTPRQGSKSMPH